MYKFVWAVRRFYPAYRSLEQLWLVFFYPVSSFRFCQWGDASSNFQQGTGVAIAPKNGYRIHATVASATEKLVETVAKKRS